MYESDFDWSQVSLPKGTQVRIVRRGTLLPPRLAWNKSLEGRIVVVEGELAPATGLKGDARRYRIRLHEEVDTLTTNMQELRCHSQVVVPKPHVEPTAASKAAIMKLISTL